ncbi:hypothetical protein AB8880_04745 [Alphaproteobacteria bacterium LSUCC0684]
MITNARNRAAHLISPVQLFPPSLSLISLAMASCNFSELEFTLGADRDVHIPVPVNFKDAEFSTIHLMPLLNDVEAVDENTFLEETFPWQEDFDPDHLAQDTQTLIEVAGFVQASHPEYISVGGAVFVDSDSNGRNSSGDIFIGVLQEQGYFSGYIPLDYTDRPLLAILGTPDNSDAAILSWRAPAGSSVISPLTELLTASALLPEKFNEFLHLPSDIDITQFNPYSGNENPDHAIRVLNANSIAQMILDASPDDFKVAMENAFSLIQPCESIASHLFEDEVNSEDIVSQALLAEENFLTGEMLVEAREASVCGVIEEATVELV